MATTLIALLAGGSVPVAVRLGMAMTAIQASIGILNDLIDAPGDRGRVPPKPVAEGLVAHPAAIRSAVIAAATGFGLAGLSGLTTLGVAVAGAACGYAYDVRLSRTVIGWLPLAIALPLVPVFAWVGVTGSIPPALGSLLPAAVLAGAGLAIGNDLADAGADRRAGVRSIAVRFGPRPAWLLQGAVLGMAVAVVWIAGPWRASWPGTGVAVAVIGSVVIVAGAAFLWPPAGATPVDGRGDTGSVSRRARPGWALEAIGVALLGAGWFLALGAGGAAG